MDILQDFVNSNTLSKATILNCVDDYSIYSFYIGEELELYTKYSSPLRPGGDDDPSFSLYYSKYDTDKIFFKDNATGKYGDVFKFLTEFMTNGHVPSLKTIMLQINSDFQLGLNDEEAGAFVPKLLSSRPPVRKNAIKIEVTAYPKETPEYLEYWDTLDIGAATRRKYYAKNIQVIHYKGESHTTIIAKTLTISYEILGHYKIYQPFAERKYKFRNDYLDVYVEGALQLEFKKDFAVITKSTKECMFFWEHFQWEVVAGKSENTMINPFFMENVLKKKYKKVFIWLDGDDAGVVAQQRYLDMYPWLIPVVFDSCIPDKDPTDYYKTEKAKGLQAEALNYLENLIIKNLT